MKVKSVSEGLIEGSLLAPLIATAAGGAFGLLIFVLLNPADLGLPTRLLIAVVAGIVAAVGLNALFTPHPETGPDH